MDSFRGQRELGFSFADTLHRWSPERLTLAKHSNASEPQWRVQDFCLSISKLSELRRALIFSSRVGQLLIRTGCGIRNYENSLHAAGMLFLFKSFLEILLLES